MKGVTRISREFKSSLNLDDYIELDDNIETIKNVLDSLDEVNIDVKSLYSPVFVEVLDSTEEKICVDFYTDVDSLLTSLICSSVSGGLRLDKYIDNLCSIHDCIFEDTEGSLLEMSKELVRNVKKIDVILNKNKHIIKRLKDFISPMLGIKPREIFRLPLELEDKEKERIQLFSKSLSLFTVLDNTEMNCTIKGGYLISGLFKIRKNQGDDYVLSGDSISDIKAILDGRKFNKYLSDSNYVAFLPRRDIRVSLVYLETVNDIVKGI